MAATEITSVGGVRDRLHICTLGCWWKDQRLEYSSGNIIYRGVHRLHDADAGDAEWAIWKFTYDGTDITRIEGPLTGTWTGRASLAWGA